MVSNTATKALDVSFIRSLHEVAPEDWNRLAGSDYPFLRHEFLLALEDSGCTTAASGWQPFHILVHGGDGQLAALAPLYLKSNSYGEYVFDWSWADAYHQHGIKYYPKLVSAIPFTPSAGPRLCLSPELDRQALLTLIIDRVKTRAEELGASSWHILFPDSSLSDTLRQQGLLQRLGCQYQWFNDGFTDFDDYLGKFSSRKRKNIRKERQRIADDGIEFQVLEGEQIDDDLWETFYEFYQSTYFIRGRNPYLSLGFFKQIGRVMPESLVLVMACKDATPIAGALSFKGRDTLFGRYWGCSGEFQFLHFETCYYQGIEYCIASGLQRFDSGAQGEHKIQRGFEPVQTRSNHWIGHPRFRDAIEHFLTEESGYLEEYMVQARNHLPFRKES